MFRTVCVFLALGLVAGQYVPESSSHINDHAYINYLNSGNDTWSAGPNERFHGMTFDDVKHLFGTDLSHISNHLDTVLPAAYYASLTDDIPAEFSAVDTWKGLVKPIRDQQRCGSCWAFSAAEVLSDRLAIQTKSASSPVLAPEDLVSCDKSDMGCQGGRLPGAWDYLTKTGIVTDKCMPYTAGNGTAPACPTSCADGSAFTRHKAATSYAINGVTNMQKEIMTNGPIQVAFKVYKSFMTYKTGVYKKKWYEFMPEGGHAVKIVGWGTESGADYWLVANSWNTVWGLDGYFKIARGADQCGIETMGPPYAGKPAM